MRWVLGLLVVARAALGRENLVEPLKHDIRIITPKNFDGSISKYRDRFPGAVLYYRNSKQSKSFINDEWDGVAKALKGMAHIGGVDCSEYSAFCKSEDAFEDGKDYIVRLYPSLPLPARNYDGPLERQKMVTQLTRMIPAAKIEPIKEEKDMTLFVGDHPSIPKVILFTEKSRASPMFNAIIHSFSDRMNFAIVSGPVDGPLQKRFRVTKVPTLILKKGDLTMSLKGAHTYRGEMKFQEIFEWLNVHSETFVKGFRADGEPEPQHIAETRPWLIQRVPEMMKGSHNDICFKKSKGLCAVYLKKEDTLTDSERTMLEELSDQYSADRKLGFHWSWMDVSREPNFAKLFKLTGENSSRALPSLVVINPHKRLRFSMLPADETAARENIVKFLEKIESGDGRFTVIKGNKVPAFEKRSPPTPPSEAKGGNEEL